MSRLAASEAKRKPKRKVKRILESSESEEEHDFEEGLTHWELRDSQTHPLNFTITAEIAAKWKEDESKLRARKKKKPPVAPMVINKDLSQEALLAIGETLTEDINTGALSLKTNFDIEAIDFVHLSRAPGVTDAEMDRYKTRAQEQKEGIDAACYVPLLWFTEVMMELPFLPVVKQMYITEAKEIALNTSAASFREVWKHAIIVFSLRKQDVADYMWHAQESSGDSKSMEVAAASKQQRIE
jgi:hypothetical protein